MYADFPEYFKLLIQTLPDRVQESGESEAEDGFPPDTAPVVAPIPPNPAPWAYSDLPWVSDDALTTVADVADASQLLDPSAIGLVPDHDLLDYWLNPKYKRPLRLPADAIAVYRPWHLWEDDWGIYVSEEALTLFTAGLAQLTGASLGQLAPLALRQILEHEWIHFAFEVAAAEIGDALGEAVYVGYVRERFGRADTRYSIGPLEEIVASWAEVEFARNPPRGFRRIRPRGYGRAVEHLLSRAGPGYSEWHHMQDWDDAIEITIGVISLIADRSLLSYRWGAVADSEKRQVPIVWVGDPAKMAAFGAFPKSVGPPTIRRLKQWLSHIGATPAPRRGKGSHEQWTLPNGRRIGYATSAGFLLPPEARNLADALGITRHDLFQSVAQMTKVELSAR